MLAGMAHEGAMPLVLSLGGVPKLLKARRIPGTDWFLVIALDEAEATAGLAQVFNATLISVVTLTAASTVIFLDSPWNRANKEQAEDRAHRIGTTSNVNIITIVCKDTIDERIEELINKKGAMADALVDGKVDLSKSEVIDYLLG